MNMIIQCKFYRSVNKLTSRVITVEMRDPSLAGWLLNWCPGKELFPFWMMVAHICPAWVLQSTTNKLIHHAAAKKYSCIYNNHDLMIW